MWYAVDLFTNEVIGPYETDTQALDDNADKAVSVEWSRRKRRIATKPSN